MSVDTVAMVIIMTPGLGQSSECHDTGPGAWYCVLASDSKTQQYQPQNTQQLKQLLIIPLAIFYSLLISRLHINIFIKSMSLVIKYNQI